METVYKPLFTSVNRLKNAVYRDGVKLVVTWVKRCGFTRRVSALGMFMYRAVYIFTQVLPPATHKLYTFFTQAENRGVERILSIQTLPYGIHLFANHVIELDGLFYFFD